MITPPADAGDASHAAILMLRRLRLFRALKSGVMPMLPILRRCCARCRCRLPNEAWRHADAVYYFRGLCADGYAATMLFTMLPRRRHDDT